MQPGVAHDTWRVVEIHYYRVPRERWELMLLRARQSGANAVSSYIPWIHHEPEQGRVDLSGATAPERDLVGFVQLCADAGLGFIAKPGPFVDSEMLGGGVPTWLIRHRPDLWARRFDGEPLRHSDSFDERLSYDHPEHQLLAAGWLKAVAVALEPFAPPAASTLWAWQIDNEAPGDGMLVHEAADAASPLRADYASVGRWQAWLAARHGSVDALNAAWGSEFASFADVAFPTEWQPPADAAGLRRWLDVDRFADAQVAAGLGAFAEAVRSVLGDRVPLFHDWLCMPWRLGGMLVEPGVLADTCEWVGHNVYAEDVDPAAMIAGTNWYKMNDVEYVHHAWWRTRLCHTLSPAGRPHLVPEISARQDFYLQCCLVGGMDAPCIYMLHSSEPEPEGLGAFQRWAEEAPVLPDGTTFEWWWNLRCLFLCLEAGGSDLATSPLPAAAAIAYDHAGERAARYAGVIPGAGFPEGSELGAVAAGANTTAAGVELATLLVDAGVPFDVVDVSRRAPNDWPLVIVPQTTVMSRSAQQALADRAAVSPGSVVLAGAAPAYDEHLSPCALLTGLPAFDLPSLAVREGTATPAGIDIAVRVGATGTRYVTVVNRTQEAWEGAAAGVNVRVGAASVHWMAVDPSGEVTAALLHGEAASAGVVRSTQGQTSVALLDDAWHVIAQERTVVTLPAASIGRPVWRVTLSGQVHDVGVVGTEAAVSYVPLDDRGRTDRLVVGGREAADAVAAAVHHYLRTTLTQAEVEAAELGVELSTAVHQLRRLRSAAASGDASPDEMALLAPLARLVSRLNDIRLGES
jgi:hypothetical protein